MVLDWFTIAAVTIELQKAVAYHKSSLLYLYVSVEGEQTCLKGVCPLLQADGGSSSSYVVSRSSWGPFHFSRLKREKNLVESHKEGFYGPPQELVHIAFHGRT